MNFGCFGPLRTNCTSHAPTTTSTLTRATMTVLGSYHFSSEMKIDYEFDCAPTVVIVWQCGS
jgi:hypothetical protein